MAAAEFDSRNGASESWHAAGLRNRSSAVCDRQAGLEVAKWAASARCPGAVSTREYVSPGEYSSNTQFGTSIARAVMEPVGDYVANTENWTCSQEVAQQLEMAAESAEASLWRLDLATGGLRLGGRFRQMFDLPLDTEATLERLLSVVHPEDRQTARRVMSSPRAIAP